MPKGTGWHISMIAVFVGLSFVYLTPTLVSKLPSWWGGLLPKDKIHLGLDMQGGTHLVMEVDTQKAIEGSLDLIATDLEDSLTCLLYTSDAADEEDSVDLGGRRIIKKKKNK